MGFALEIEISKEHRRAICVHEAAHAVMHAFCGSTVYGVAVAPVGARDWAYECRRGLASDDIWGACEASNPASAQTFMRWNADEVRYDVNRAGFEAVCLMEAQVGFYIDVETAILASQAIVRKHLLATLAGPVGEAIHLGEVVKYAAYPMDLAEGEDLTKAAAYEQFLPGPNEYDYAVDLAEQTLRKPDVWAMVLKLADELERHGEVGEGLDAFLPASIEGWPPPPVMRDSAPLVVRPL